MFMMCLIAKFHMPGSSGSLVTAIKLNAKYRFCGSHNGDHDEYTIVWHVTLYGLVKVYPTFQRNVLLPSLTLQMETVHSSKTSVNF